MEMFTHTYKSKTLHNYLKNISESVVSNEYLECIRETALQTMMITHGPIDHLTPSAWDSIRTSFYKKAKKYIPENYIQNAQKAVTERLSKPAKFERPFRRKSLLSRAFSSI